LPPDWVHSVLLTAAGSVIGAAAIAGSSCASLSVVSTGIRSPKTGVFFCLCLIRLHPLAAMAAAMRSVIRKCFGFGIVVLWIGSAWQGVDIDPEAASEVASSVAAALSNTFVLGDRGEQPARLLLLALLDQRHAGHFAGASEPWVAGLRQRLEPRDDLIGREAVKLQRGRADRRGVAIGLRQSVVGDDF